MINLIVTICRLTSKIVEPQFYETLRCLWHVINEIFKKKEDINH